ncbi:unnamed protein product [Somion occarium]|uniref:Uncharacterized protein n=1 Tax=Somion occarium TaxID=3059160 RepID=A0ABP1CLQ4_9APHY
MVKYIKPKPLSKRELKDLHRLSPSPLLASPVIPSSPFLVDTALVISASLSSELKGRRKVRSGKRRISERLLPRANKSGGKHKPIAIPNNASPMRDNSPVISPEIDSGSESDFTSLVKSAKNRIRQSADKMREDGRKLHNMKMKDLFGDVDLDLPSTPIRPASPVDHPIYLSPERKRRANLLKKKASGSPTIISSSSTHDEPFFSITLSESSGSLKVMLYPMSESERAAHHASPMKDVSNKLGIAKAPCPSNDEYDSIVISFKNLPAEEAEILIQTGILAATNAETTSGVRKTAKNMKAVKPAPTPSAPPLASANIPNSLTPKHKARKKKKKSGAAARAIVNHIANENSSISPQVAVTEPEVKVATPLQSRTASPVPGAAVFPAHLATPRVALARSRMNSPKPQTELPEKRNDSTAAYVKISSPTTATTTRTLRRSPVPGTTETDIPIGLGLTVAPEKDGSMSSGETSTQTEGKVYSHSRTPSHGPVDGIHTSGPTILKAYRTALDSYYKILQPGETIGLALACSDSGKLADILSKHSTSKNIQNAPSSSSSPRPAAATRDNSPVAFCQHVVADVARKRQFPISKYGGCPNVKSAKPSDAVNLTVPPGSDAAKYVAMSDGQSGRYVSEETALLDIEAGADIHRVRSLHGDTEGNIFVRDKRSALMRKVTAFVRSVTAVFLSPWRVLTRAFESARE